MTLRRAGRPTWRVEWEWRWASTILARDLYSWLSALVVCFLLSARLSQFPTRVDRMLRLRNSRAKPAQDLEIAASGVR